MRIQHNIMAMNAYRNYTNNVSAMQKNLEKLSSGYKINRAGDDAAGLAISEKMRAQITGLETAQKNAKDGISLVQTAEGALTEVHDMLNRMVELATQSANGTYDNTTDRKQMQKEVEQLLEEIDRIADSSNFNGINLLDGTLGLNSEAFGFSTADAVAANDGTINLSSYLVPSTTGPDALHLEGASATGANPGASIDLNTLKIKVDGKGAASKAVANVKFVIGGTTYTAKLSNATSNAVTKNTTDILNALKKAMTEDNTNAVQKTDGTTSGTAANNDSIKIGDGVYSVAVSGTKVTLTFEGYFDGSTYVKKSATAGDFSSDKADNFNTSLGMTVALDGVTNGEVSAGTFVHDTMDVDQAKAKKAESLAGIDMRLDANIVKNNNILEIDGKKFKFKTTATGFTSDASATTIDVSKYDKDDQVHAAVDLLSKQTEITGTDGRKWKIASKNNDTIHFEQTAKSDSGKELDGYAKLTNLISAKGEATSAKNIGTNIEIDNTKVAEGNTLNIDGVKYVFTENTSGKRDSADTKYVKFTKGGSDAATNLQAKISGSTINTAKDTVTVRASTSDGKAPVVLGKGLTLQIGDTSDDFNQLNVAVYDCHASSIGVGGLDISTEEAAQAAIKNIKDAINFVSDVRGTLGATQNRLDHTINNLSVMTENIQDAESTIRDTDVAEEMMAYTKNNILIQSAQAMLAQANQVPQGVLQLLQ